MILYPYKLTQEAFVQSGGDPTVIFGDGLWVFDDETTGLKWEAFISGTDTVMDYLTQDISTANKGFKLTFTDAPFDDYQMVGRHMGTGYDNCGYGIIGNWYRWTRRDYAVPAIDGWLCPALFLYFSTAPSFLYVRADESVIQ